MKQIPIFLSSDDNYAPFVATTIASVCDNTTALCAFYILDGGIETENKNKILSLTDLYDNCSIEYIYIDAEKYFKNFITHSYITLPTYYRFIIPQLKPNIERILYLDVDIIVKNDVRDLFNADLDNKVLGAVMDLGDPNYIKRLKYNVEIKPSHTYFNAGVLLIDCKKWNEQNISEKLFDIEQKYRGKLLCNDQDVLNKVFENNYKMLPEKFNALAATDGTVIRHYYSKPKPWEIKQGIKNSSLLLSDIELFWYYAQKTPFCEQLLSNCKYKSSAQIQLLMLYKKTTHQNIIKVSVIIPVYNTENYLRKCLDSVCNQTLRDIEIVCINDCSPDSCLEILKEYASKDERIKIIDFKENKGAACARNAGIDAAQGEYLGFVDSDDFIDLDFYEKLYNKAIETGADAVKGNYAVNGVIVDSIINSIIDKDKNAFCFSFCSAIFKTKTLNQYNIRFPILIDMEDPLFTLNFAQISNNVVIVENARVNVVQRLDSQTATVPTLKRLIDRLIGLNEMIMILNKSVIRKKSYIFVISFWLSGVFFNCQKNRNRSFRKILAEGLIKNFNKIKFKDEIVEKIMIQSKDLAISLKNNDAKKLASLNQSNFYRKDLFKNLRNNIKNKSTNLVEHSNDKS